MLSAFPPIPSFLDGPFPVLEPAFPPWNAHHQEPPLLFHASSHQPYEPVPVVAQEPASSISGSCTTNPHLPTQNVGSIEPNRIDAKNSNSGSIIDERKHRRMVSNRESARRSRMRKQKHLDNLRTQVNRLKVGNRETMSRLSLVVHQNQSVRRENEYLRSEAVMLRQRLWDIRQVLLVRQLKQSLNPSAWPCNNFTSINGVQLQHHSLIT